VGEGRPHTVEHQLSLMRVLQSAYSKPAGGEPPPGGDSLRACAGETAPAGNSASGLRPHPSHRDSPNKAVAGGEVLTPGRLSLRETPCTRHPDLLPSESGFCTKSQSTPQKRTIIWSDLGLEELFALIQGARLFIGNDSGPTHAAAALARPIVVVWGSSNFSAWHPWGTDFEAVRSDLPCIPCPGYSCAEFGRPKCIQEIPLGNVVSACEKMLAHIRVGRYRDDRDYSPGNGATLGNGTVAVIISTPMLMEKPVLIVSRPISGAYTRQVLGEDHATNPTCGTALHGVRDR